MSSHILQEIQATVDRIIIIDNGKIVADGTSEELISNAQGMTQLHLQVHEADENKIQDMKAVIPSINLKNISQEGDSFLLTIEYGNSSDPRKDIFKYAVDNSWTITEMTVTEKNLEDIFRNLTSQSIEGVEDE